MGKQCPLCSWPNPTDKCANPACQGSKHPNRMQEHADFLIGQVGMKLDGWELSKEAKVKYAKKR